MKKKYIAAPLALLFGVFGVHRFYLGQRGLGILYFMGFMITFAITVSDHVEFPPIVFMGILGFVDSILLFAMPQEDFDDRYNKKYFARRRNRQEEYPEYEEPYSNTSNTFPKAAIGTGSNKEDLFKRMGIERFRAFDFDGAIDAFSKSLEANLTSPTLHFNLACSYSMLENANKAFHHLEKAIENGFSDFGKIHSHQALAFLRKQADFQKFVDNGYKRISALPQAQNNVLENIVSGQSTAATPTKDVFDEILQLGDLKEKGLISEEEFARQKIKLLNE
jgi:TM2 domain-containing membrane protein YozV